MSKTIIGYKAPYDMFGGDIEKDTLYKPLASKFNTMYAAVDANGKCIDSGKTNLPKEIVETWEAVYSPEFKVGDIVVSLRDVGDLRQIGDIFTVLGLTGYGSIYYREGTHGSSSEFRLATPGEIEGYKIDQLIAEARKRYPIGTRFVGAHVPDHKDAISIVTNTNFMTGSNQTARLTLTAMTNDGEYYTGPDGVHGNTSNVRIVYYDGRWAEIVTTPVIRINGYDAKFNEDSVVFGCARIGKEVFISLYELNRLKLHNSNREIESVTIGNGEFSKEVIKEIAEYYLPSKPTSICL